MSQYAILTDLNRCVGCLGCTVACKAVNHVPVGQYYNKVTRIGPRPRSDGSGKIDLYFLPMQCQHCENPACVDVCPTGASVKIEDGTVQISEDTCIGCQLCVSACPYGVRFMNEDAGVVQKCDLCHDLTEEGQLPQCVSQCCARARYWGDIEQGPDAMEGPADYRVVGTENVTYEDVKAARVTFGDYAQPYAEGDVYRLPDKGTGPSFVYVLRNHEWTGEY